LADYEIPEDLHYSSDDEWVRDENGHVVIGVSDYAQQQLGDIVFVELPEVGTKLVKGDAFGVIESVKAVSDLFAPVSGAVAAVNELLEDRPEIINEDCYGDGWLIAVEGADPADLGCLLVANAYREYIDECDE
jgi:glycine cleavage system H protein